MDGDASSIEEEAVTRFSKLESIWEEVGKKWLLGRRQEQSRAESYMP